jgi:predicted deacylase
MVVVLVLVWSLDALELVLEQPPIRREADQVATAPRLRVSGDFEKPVAGLSVPVDLGQGADAAADAAVGQAKGLLQVLERDGLMARDLEKKSHLMKR